MFVYERDFLQALQLSLEDSLTNPDFDADIEKALELSRQEFTLFGPDSSKDKFSEIDSMLETMRTDNPEEPESIWDDSEQVDTKISTSDPDTQKCKGQEVQMNHTTAVTVEINRECEIDNVDKRPTTPPSNNLSLGKLFIRLIVKKHSDFETVSAALNVTSTPSCEKEVKG